MELGIKYTGGCLIYSRWHVVLITETEYNYAQQQCNFITLVAINTLQMIRGLQRWWQLIHSKRFASYNGGGN